MQIHTKQLASELRRYVIHLSICVLTQESVGCNQYNCNKPYNQGVFDHPLPSFISLIYHDFLLLFHFKTLTFQSILEVFEEQKYFFYTLFLLSIKPLI